MNMDKFKQDHVAVLTSISELRKLVQAGVAENAASIAKMVVSMSSAIKLHLAAEDKMLYPTLARSTQPNAAEIGKKFQSEMGNIAAAYMEFAGKWSIGSKIAAKPEEFKSDANDIFKALFQRVQREDKELYPVAEHA